MNDFPIGTRVTDKLGYAPFTGIVASEPFSVHNNEIKDRVVVDLDFGGYLKDGNGEGPRRMFIASIVVHISNLKKI